MAMGKRPPATVDAYINRYPPEVRRVLKAMRQTIRAAAPEAVESISYQMPAYKLDGKPSHPVRARHEDRALPGEGDRTAHPRCAGACFPHPRGMIAWTAETTSA